MLKKVRLARPAFFVFVLSGALTAVFAAGLGTGLYFYPRFNITDDDHDDHQDDHSIDLHEDDHEDDHVALTRQACENIGLRLGTVTHGDYWKTVLMPAEVVEIPGQSNLSLSAPVTGVIKEVQVLPGESIRAEQVIFAIRITDEELTGAQAKLLAALTRQDVVRQEILRLNPIIQTGAVPAKRTRDLEYELQQLEAEQQTLTQQLRGRGLPDAMVDSLLTDRKLATTLEIPAPAFIRCDDEAELEGPTGENTSGYSIEDLLVHPGKSVQRGDSLCTLAYHAELYIQGTAFESELDTLRRIAKNDWTITAESHEFQAGESDRVARADLRLLRVDNHVDPETQTVRFFVSLSNEVEQSQRDQDGRHFEQWRFRPGQRIHLRLPVEQWKNQITLPLDAVAIDGPNAFVFAEHNDEHDDDHVDDDGTADMHDAHHYDVMVELEPVPVRLLHRDDRVVVLARNQGFDANTKIALNNAHKLHLAMKMQAGAGAGTITTTTTKQYNRAKFFIAAWLNSWRAGQIEQH